MYTSLCAIRSWNWNWKLTQDNFLIEHWIQRTHRCSAVRCWPWGIYSSWLASRDLGTTRSSYLAWVGPVLQTKENLYRKDKVVTTKFRNKDLMSCTVTSTGLCVGYAMGQHKCNTKTWNCILQSSGCFLPLTCKPLKLLIYSISIFQLILAYILDNCLLNFRDIFHGYCI